MSRVKFKEQVVKLWDNVNKLPDKLYADDRLLSVSIIMYKIFLDITYCTYVAKIYHYSGFNAVYDFGRILLVNALFLLSLPLICLYIRSENRASNYVMVIWGFMYYIPGLSFITFYDCSDYYVLYFISFFVSLCVVNHFVIILCDNNKNVFRDHKDLFLVVFIVLIGICTFYLYKYQGFKVRISLKNVYDERKMYYQTTGDYSLVFRYLKNPITKIVPILVYVLCRRRKLIPAVFLDILQLSLFAMGANKIDLFWLILAMCALFVKDLGNKWIATGFVFISFISAITTPIKENLINDLLVRRMLFVPNHLSVCYFDFFHSHPFIWFSDSILRNIRDYPYDGQITYVIGEAIRPGTGVNANNGLAGVAFADCGYWGIIIYPLLFGIIFYFLNWFARGKDKGVVILVSFIIALIYIDSNYFTSIFTHGVFLVLLFLLLFPKGKVSARRSS